MRMGRVCHARQPPNVGAVSRSLDRHVEPPDAAPVNADRRGLLRWAATGGLGLVVRPRRLLRIPTTKGGVRLPAAKNKGPVPSAKRTDPVPSSSVRRSSCPATLTTPTGESYRADAPPRVDLTEGFVVGSPLRLSLSVVDAVCRPIGGRTLEVWHCDASGAYSASENGHRELRGTQVTDQAGMAVFLTIFPGWYATRSVHIHVLVRGVSPVATQLFFPDSLNEKQRLVPPYATNTNAVTLNSDDPYFRQLGGSTLVDSTESARSVEARFILVVPS